MKYTEDYRITNFEEVKDFFNYLINERNCNFYPTDDLKDYAINKDGVQVFTDSEVICFNRLVDECFDVCTRLGEDAHDVCMEIVYKKSCIEIPLKELLN